MKISRIFCSAVLVILMAAGWGGFVRDLGSDNTAYSSSLAEAREYAQRGLYELSIQNYETALQQKETQAVRDELLSVCQISYNEGTLSLSQYRSVLSAACSLYPDNAEYWERLLSSLLEDGTSSTAYSYAVQAQQAGISSQTLDDLIAQIVYAYRVKGTAYEEVHIAPSGVCSVYNGFYWGVLESNGDERVNAAYRYASPVGADGSVLLVNDLWAHIVDSKGVAKAVLDGPVSCALAYGDGYLPIKNEDGSWSYIRCADGAVLGNYDDLSAFSGGRAAVKAGDSWCLIDTEFTQISSGFDDVKLFGNGVYENSGIMIACTSGKYGIYDALGERKNDFTASDMDVYMGEYIAYQGSDGTWGFVTSDGTVIIEPQFAQAKSFSNGLAAVCNGENWGFIDVTGKVVIDYQFSDAMYFSDSGTGFVKSVDSWQLIELKYQ